MHVSKDLKAAVYSGGSSDTAKAPSYLRTFFNFSRFFLATRPVNSVRLGIKKKQSWVQKSKIKLMLILFLRLKKCRISRALIDFKAKYNHHYLHNDNGKDKWFRKIIYKLTNCIGK
jgi:hypothetical protein